MANVIIEDNLFKSIKEIAKKEGTNEEIFIKNILSEVVKNYDDCELLERLNKGLAEIKTGDGIEWKQ